MKYMLASLLCLCALSRSAGAPADPVEGPFGAIDEDDIVRFLSYAKGQRVDLMGDLEKASDNDAAALS